MVNEHWIARRGFAYGFLCSASSVSGAAVPFAVEKLLQSYGYQMTLRALAIGLFAITRPLTQTMGPGSGSECAPARIDWSFLMSPLLDLLVVELCQGMELPQRWSSIAFPCRLPRPLHLCPLHHQRIVQSARKPNRITMSTSCPLK